MALGEEFLERVEREFEQHLLPVYHPNDLATFSKVVQTAKAVSAKLTFVNLQDAGDPLLLCCCCSAAASHSRRMKHSRTANIKHV
jgi:hypothetical protein